MDKSVMVILGVLLFGLVLFIVPSAMANKKERERMGHIREYEERRESEREEFIKSVPKSVLDNLDSLGVDDSKYVNDIEAIYLNTVYGGNKPDDFDFRGKKIAYKYSSGYDEKDYYYNMQKEYIARNTDSFDSGNLLIFNAAQKAECGYDGIIIVWSKFVNPADVYVKSIVKSESKSSDGKKRKKDKSSIDIPLIYNLSDNVIKQLDNVGVDSNPLLNDSEANMLNNIFINKPKCFDFTGKRFAYIRTELGGGVNKIFKISESIIASKTEYLKMYKDYIADNNLLCDIGNLYIFNEDEKLASGGYDGVIIYWWNYPSPSKDELINILNPKEPEE